MRGIQILCLLIPLLTTIFPTVVPWLKSGDGSANKYSESALGLLEHKILREQIHNLNVILARRPGCWSNEVSCKRSGRAAHMELFDFVTKPKLKALYVGPSAIKLENPGKSIMWKATLYNDTDLYTN